MNELGLFTSRGKLVIEVIKRPGSSIRELSDRLFLTRRSVWGLVGELRKLGFIIATRQGRKHHYYVSSAGIDELRKLTEGKVEW